MSNTEVREVVLNQFEELRLEVDFDKVVEVKLKSGNAEVFGSELGTSRGYEFSGDKIAIFTWEGCKLEITGKCSSEYTSSETPMETYMDIHCMIQEIREKSKQNQMGVENGPNVLVIGPPDSGKTSICRTLLNYAVREECTPLYINLDPTEGQVSIPGTLSATKITQVLNSEDGFMSHGLIGPAGVSDQPLVYHFGYSNASDHVVLYKGLVKQLAEQVVKKYKEDQSCRHAGCIIDTSGDVDNVFYPVIDEIIKSYSVTHILVVGSEKIYSDFYRKHQNNSQISVLKVPKSGGVVGRESKYLKELQYHQVKRYFYGTRSEEFQPFSTTIKFQDISLCKFSKELIAPSSTLPLGENRKISETQLLKVDLDDSLIHSIFSVLYLDPPTNIFSTKLPSSTPMNDGEDRHSSGYLTIDDNEFENSVLSSNVMGFISITSVDMKRHTMVVLSPAPGRIPKKVMLLNQLKWMEI